LWWSMGVFCALCVICTVPLPPTGEPDTSDEPGIGTRGIAAICAVKCATLCACVALFHTREAAACGGGRPEGDTGARLHDFYRLRVLADIGGGTGVAGWGPLAFGTLLRASSLCSVCLLSSHAWAAVQSRRAAWANIAAAQQQAAQQADADTQGRRAAKRAVEIHELRIGVTLLCIVLASFSVEAAHDYHSSAPSSSGVGDMHSTGFLLSQAVLQSNVSPTSPSSPQEKTAWHSSSHAKEMCCRMRGLQQMRRSWRCCKTFGRHRPGAC